MPEINVTNAPFKICFFVGLFGTFLLFIGLCIVQATIGLRYGYYFVLIQASSRRTRMVSSLLFDNTVSRYSSTNPAVLYALKKDCLEEHSVALAGAIGNL
jgi:hypothetical protein